MTDIAGERPVDEAPKPSTKDKIAAAKLPERTVDICLRGDLQADWEDLRRQIVALEAEAQADDRLNSAARKQQRDLAVRLEELEAEMRDQTIVFRLRALPRKQWDALMKEHPPRSDNDEDTYLGYNPDTFMSAAIQACTYSPDDLDAATWDDLFDNRLTRQQFAELQDAMMALNVRKVSIPNSRAVSRILKASDGR